MIQLGCNGCVHEEGKDNNYFGECKNCVRNPDYYDVYFKETKEADAKIES